MNIWGFILLSVSYSFVKAFQSTDEKLVKSFLSDFHGFNEESGNFGDAVKNIQKIIGLNEDGKVSKELVAHITKPRCGFIDHNKKSKRYSLYRDKWDSGMTYNYYVHDFLHPKTMTTEQIYEAFLTGFSYWSSAGNIFFKRSTKTEGSMFSVSFVSYNHYMYDVHNKFTVSIDPNPIDNVPGGLLAHAYFPRDGNIHLDSSEHWTENTEKGTNLRLVAAHEMGHAIGLYHSQDQAALMNPSYMGYIPHEKYKLPHDDSQGIIAHYGPKPGLKFVRKDNNNKTTSKIMKEFCSSNNINSVFQFSDGYIYVATGKNKVYRLINKTVDVNFKQINFPQKLRNTDAIFFDNLDNRLIIFKGKRIFSAKGKTLDKLNFTELNIVRNGAFQGRVDAAFVRDKVGKSSLQRFWAIQNGKFVSGSIKHNEVRFSRRTTKFSEILKMSIGSHLPSSIDGALVIGRKDQVRLLLFTGNSVYVGSPTGRKDTQFNIPSQYPITFKQLINC